MRFFEKTKGAISIFLAILLLPMMTLAAAFVDAGKVKLAKGMAESAGDLALNTALTNYDSDLKELYGLMATAQSTDDLFNKLPDYFMTSITSSGVSEEDALTYVEQIMAQLGLVSESNDVSDIMNMEVADFAVKKLSNANLANPTLIKKQIVDFMKYRSPINTGLSFISSLKSFTTLKQQTKLIEKKQDYYEAQQTVMEDLQKAWSFVKAYNNTEVALNPNYVQTISNNMKIFANGGTIGKDSFDGYNSKNTDSPKGLAYRISWACDDVYDYLYYDYRTSSVDFTYYAPGKAKNVVDVTEYPAIYMSKLGQPYTYEKFCEQYYKEEISLPTEETFKNYLEAFFAQLNKVEALEGVKESLQVDSNINYELRVFVNSVRGSEGVDDYAAAVYGMYNAYQHLKAAEIWVEQYDYIEEKKESDSDKDKNGKDDKKSEDTKKTIKSADILNKQLKLQNNSSKNYSISNWCELAEAKYGSHMGKYPLVEEIASSMLERVSAEYGKQQSKILIETEKSAKIIKVYEEQLGTAKTSLETAIKYLNDAKSKLNGTVATAKSEWNTAANNSAIQDTSLAKQDKAEIDQLDKYLNVDNIDKLITRLTNVKNDIDAVITEMKKYTYLGTYYGDIDGLSDMESAYEKISGHNFHEKTFKKSELNSKTTELISKYSTSGNIKYDWVTQNGHEPNLNLSKTTLYSYLSSKFASVGAAEMNEGSPTPSTDTGEDTKNGKTLYEDIKNTSKEQADTQKNGLGEEKTEDGDEKKPTEIKDLANIPTVLTPVANTKETPSGKVDTNADSGISSASSSLDSMFGDDFLGKLGDLGTDIRDALYVSDYVMSMFSYDTIEKEYKEDNKDKLGEDYKIKEGDLQTLTKCDISTKNNYAYRNEVEYIIYGGTYAGNSAKAYASIFGIRFGFNVVYAFATSEIRDSALAIATPISAATLGIIPVPLIQAVIIIGIACCESGIDIAELANGKKIPLYKNKDTWNCSITGLVNKAKDIAGAELKKAATHIVDEGVNKLNGLLDMADEEITSNIEEYGKDATTAVTKAYDNLITENANLAIQQLTTYVNTAVQEALCLEEGETYETKKTEVIEWVKSELNSWGAQFTGDDIASIVKREAVKVIVNNSDSFINGLFDELEKTAKNGTGVDIGKTIEAITSGATVDALGGAVMEKITKIQDEIKKQLDTGVAEVKNFKDQIKSDIEASIKNGAQDLKNTINSKLDGMFGGDGTGSAQGGASTGMASFFSFSYSDYLRLFLLIGTFANEEKVLLRTADVIQANMSKMIKKDDGYKLSDSAVYVKATADIQVKPTLLALPFFASVENNSIHNSNWYTISYSGIAGY